MKEVKHRNILVAALLCFRNLRKWREAIALSRALTVVNKREGFSKLHEDLWRLERELWAEIHGEKNL